MKTENVYITEEVNLKGKMIGLDTRMYKILGWRTVVEGIHTRFDKGEVNGPRQSNRIFKLGNNATLSSKGRYTIQ